MLYLNIFIGLVLLVMALLHMPHPAPLGWLPYLIGALLSFITLRNELALVYVRMLAVATALVMFFFFAGFFALVPNLEADWYMHQEGLAAVTRISASFFMIPVLSDYSCRLKADCRDAMTNERRSFFSAPE